MITTTNTANNTDEKVAREWLSNNKDHFEKIVVAAAYADPEQLKKFLPHLCQETTKKGGQIWVDDFSKPPLFALYRAVAEHAHLIRKSELADRRITPQQMHSFITAYANMAECISLPEVDQAMAFMSNEVAPLATPENFAYVTAIYQTWLRQQKRMRIMVQNIQGRDDGTDLTEKLIEADRLLADPTSFDIHGFGEGIDTKEEITQRIPTGITSLDIFTGGGMGLGEATLVIAAPSAGKTLLTCQLAGGMAVNGTPVLIISTEETHRQLEPRFVSNLCKIPIGRLQDGVKPEGFSRDEKARYDEMRRRVHSKLLQIVNWEDKNRDLRGSFRALLDAAAKKMEVLPQVVILDWLGGAFGRSDSSDPQIYRRLLRLGAEAMSDVAKEFNIHTFTCAQANLKQCINHLRVDATVLSECKTLQETMTNAIGITLFVDKDVDVDDQKDGIVFRKDQYFYVSKARRGSGGKISVKRDFTFQRYLPGNSSSSR